ncbi:MAG: hypothetical protein R6X20_14255 [Phycisphaerae bacterium]
MAAPKPVSRRNFLGKSLGAAGALGMAAGTLACSEVRGAPSRRATPASAVASASTAAGEAKMPRARIGNARISRLMVGGNLIGGFMHSRDLRYVNQLFDAYVDEDKILETLKIAEAQGVNTVFETGAQYVRKYNERFGGHMQFIPHIKVDEKQKEGDLERHIQQQVDSGACALYVWGVAGDTLTMHGRVDLIKRAVDLAKAHDLPVGVGGHSLQMVVQCEKHRVPCDFYVKTFHRDDYPSATSKAMRKDFAWLTGAPGWYDNMWCINPEETIEVMRQVEKPWIAFKVLAAGAIHPRQGLRYAFDNGADVVALGMFDFQVEEDCHIARDAIQRAQKRPRPWRA